MQEEQGTKTKKPINPRGDHELLWVIGTIAVMIALFQLPKDFWLWLNFAAFFTLIHGLVWHHFRKGEKNMAFIGFLVHLAPIYLSFLIGLIVLWWRGDISF